MRANYKVEVASGVFLALGVAALVWLATQATNYGQDVGKDGYTISARFSNIGDLKDRAPVKIGGVLVGKVESVALDEATFEAFRRHPGGHQCIHPHQRRARRPLRRTRARRRPHAAGRR